MKYLSLTSKYPQSNCPNLFILFMDLIEFFQSVDKCNYIFLVIKISKIFNRAYIIFDYFLVKNMKVKIHWNSLVIFIVRKVILNYYQIYYFEFIDNIFVGFNLINETASRFAGRAYETRPGLARGTLGGENYAHEGC